MEHLNELDKELLNILQTDFPLDSEPFKELAEQLNTSEEEILERTKAMKDSGLIRQLSAIFDTKSLGYKSSLVAMKIPEAEIDAKAAIINEHPGVSHNYKRDHEYNLWFTIAVPPGETIEEHVNTLAEKVSAEDTLILPTIKMFKIGVKFDVTGKEEATAKEKKTHGHKHRKNIEPLTDAEIAVVRELQKDLPITGRPFLPAAETLNITEEELLNIAKDFQDKGIMRRFAAVLRHRKAGFTANAMGVWQAPEEKIEELGQQMASFKAVSHCYQRPSYPNWPYNLFTMVHAKTLEEAQEILKTMSEETGLTNYTYLVSTIEYKKERVQYFV